jgi:5-methylcytosine-specific restriction enzyme subunit McrC
MGNSSVPESPSETPTADTSSESGTLTPRLLRVRENELVTLPPLADPRLVRERMLRLEAGGQSAFSYSRGVLRAGGVVGYADLGAVRIEILPKEADVPGPAADLEDSQFLLDILSDAGLVPKVSSKSGRVAVRPGEPVVDALIGAFARNLHNTILHGPPRRYNEREEEGPTLRGRLSVTALAGQPPGRAHLLTFRHAPLQVDNELSRIVRATIVALLPACRSSASERELMACLSHLDGVGKSPLNAERIHRVQLASFERHWAPALEMAMLLATRGSANPIGAGNTELLTLLFPLADLFESLLRRTLQHRLVDASIHLRPPDRSAFLLRSEKPPADLIRLRPDYVFVAQNTPAQVRLIGDAKWKRLHEGDGHGLKPEDVYQLTAYLLRHGCSRGVLLFPRVSWMNWGTRGWSQKALVADGRATITLGAVDVRSLVSSSAPRRSAAEHALESVLFDSLTA